MLVWLVIPLRSHWLKQLQRWPQQGQACSGISPFAGSAFDSERKRMSVVLRHRDQLLVYVKGAPGTVLERCAQHLTADSIKPLSPLIQQILAAVEVYAARPCVSWFGPFRR